jgi:hypothetical protein
MQTWNLAAGDPLSLTLAADARLAATDYTDDQIWELSLGGGEPAALGLQTTYGLRAHWMRLFPRFVRGDTTRTDPASFHAPPRLLHFYPNYLAVSFAPFDGLEALAEYWIPDSKVVAGRLRLANQSILPQVFRLEWVALLNPIERQGGMVAVQSGPTSILEGETAYLQPVVCLTGGPQPVSSPYPALAHELELYPGNFRQFSWAAAAMRSRDASFEAARAATARPWEAEQARVEMLNQSQQVAIQTGNPEWDAALALAQKTACELLMKNSSGLPYGLPHPSFVLNRRPDQGFSLRGDGSDLSHLWNGQTALDSYYLASLLLPGAPELAAGLLRNFLAVQEENGAIDWKPGLGGQHSRRLAQPLLASLAVELGPYLAQPEWYQEVFPGLLRFFNAWFDPRHDRDGDGFPEWEHPLQTGIEDSPIFDRWSPGAQGIQIERLESPALASMLLRECQSLISMARTLAETEKAGMAYARLSGAEIPCSPADEALAALCEREAALRQALEDTWDGQACIYRYRDYETHTSQPGQVVVEFNGSGRIPSRKRFDQPARLAIQIKMSEERTYAVTCTLHGFTGQGETSERIDPRGFSWHGTQGRATTENTFLAVKRVEIQGLRETDQVRVLTVDYTQEDCSLFLPLWAGLPEPDRARALVEDSLLRRYLLPFGVPLCPPDTNPQDALPGMHTAISSALMPWNHLIGEGLLRYGFRAEAARLVACLLDACVASLKTHQAFRQYIHAWTGFSAGERGHLHGLPPIGLFLKTIGIRRLSPKEIILDGFNPFPGTINVKYRKVSIACATDKTEISLAGGQTITIDRPGLHRVTLP